MNARRGIRRPRKSRPRPDSHPGSDAREGEAQRVPPCSRGCGPVSGTSMAAGGPGTGGRSADTRPFGAFSRPRVCTHEELARVRRGLSGVSRTCRRPVSAGRSVLGAQSQAPDQPAALKPFFVRRANVAGRDRTEHLAVPVRVGADTSHRDLAELHSLVIAGRAALARLHGLPSNVQQAPARA